jgi:hypothetical protein
LDFPRSEVSLPGPLRRRAFEVIRRILEGEGVLDGVREGMDGSLGGCRLSRSCLRNESTAAFEPRRLRKCRSVSSGDNDREYLTASSRGSPSRPGRNPLTCATAQPTVSSMMMIYNIVSHNFGSDEDLPRSARFVGCPVSLKFLKTKQKVGLSFKRCPLPM